MCQHNLSFGFYSPRFSLYSSAEQLLGFFIIIFRIILNTFCQFIITFICRIVRQHIKNKSFFNSLFHTIKMEWMEFSVFVQNRITIFINNKCAKSFQCLVLWSCCKCKIRTVCTHFTIFHQFFQKFVCICPFTIHVLLNCFIHTISSYTRLRTMCLVNDNSKIMFAHIRYRITYIREFLDSCNNYSLSIFNGFFQVFGGISMSYNFFTLTKSLNIVCYLLVQQSTVCNDNHRIIQTRI